MTGVGVTQDVALDRNEWRRRTRPTPRIYWEKAVKASIKYEKPQMPWDRCLYQGKKKCLLCAATHDHAATGAVMHNYAPAIFYFLQHTTKQEECKICLSYRK